MGVKTIGICKSDILSMTKRQLGHGVYPVERLAQTVNIAAGGEIKREGVSSATYKPSL